MKNEMQNKMQNKMKNKMKNKKILLTNNLIHVINFITIILFLGIITNYTKFVKCINNFINIDLNNSYILTYICLGIYIIVSLIILKISYLASSILFIILMIITRNYFKTLIFIEKFNNVNLDETKTTNLDETRTTNLDETRITNLDELNNDNLDYDKNINNKAKDYLKKQITDNKNITELEKNVINDIYDQYFLNSDNLTNLKRFNEQASDYNPINNDQHVLDILDFYK